MGSIKFEDLVEEDLNVGTDSTWVNAPGGGELRSTQLGIHTFARGQKQYSAAWTPGSITARRSVSTTVTVPDATAGDLVMASMTSMTTKDLVISGHVSAANTVKVEIFNPTAAALTVAAGTVNVLVFPFRNAAATVDTILEGTVVFDEGGGPLPVVGNTVDLMNNIDEVQASTTTDSNGLYRFTNPTVTMGDGEGYKVYAHAPPPGTGAGSVDTYDDAHYWAVGTTMVVDITMNGS